METVTNIISLVYACFFIASSFASILPISPLLGIPPQDEKYFAPDVIACKDGSKSFSKDRLNDGFCDCVDGTDEPGTSACPESKFYCRNVGSTPQLLFSSRINDRYCDCCDGSDEYDGSINCPNTCFKDGHVLNKKIDYNIERTNTNVIHTEEKKNRGNLEDLMQKLKEMRIIVMVEGVFFSCIMAFYLFRRRIRSRRRQRR